MKDFIITCKKCGSTDCIVKTCIYVDEEAWFPTIEDTYQAYVECCSCDASESEY